MPSVHSLEGLAGIDPTLSMRQSDIGTNGGSSALRGQFIGADILRLQPILTTLILRTSTSPRRSPGVFYLMPFLGHPLDLLQETGVRISREARINRS